MRMPTAIVNATCSRRWPLALEKEAGTEPIRNRKRTKRLRTINKRHFRLLFDQTATRDRRLGTERKSCLRIFFKFPRPGGSDDFLQHGGILGDGIRDLISLHSVTTEHQQNFLDLAFHDVFARLGVVDVGLKCLKAPEHPQSRSIEVAARCLDSPEERLRTARPWQKHDRDENRDRET